MADVIYALVNYFDVWGNEKDGWQVNDSRVEGTVVINEYASDKEILTGLKGIGFLTTDDRRRLTIEILGEWIEVCQRKGMKPLCSLRPNY